MKGKFEEIRDTSTLLVLRNLENEIAIIITQFTAHTSIVCIVGNKPKGRISKRLFQGNKASQAKFSEKWHFLPLDTYTYMCISGGKKCLFFGKFDVLCFLETPVLKLAYLAYCRRYRHCEIAWTSMKSLITYLNLSDSNGIQIHNHIVSTRSLSCLAKLASLSEVRSVRLRT